ncbi:Major Facilitator Superfamily protein [Friedmanniella luteola]|uniref:Multidrug efflux pump Tap n=1 Tax=Friedmanniella luteola TaxID=546871 RepID=A0A1H1MIB8_9ACTN|nr:MFS transporter [Friedmanniella luteola]SDR86498.1 Major Facilitator Superfamily protein [Friedmanniella luteola]
MAATAGLRGRLDGTRQALRNPPLARLLVVWAVWITADWALLITVSLLALDVGGPAAVGLVGAVRVLPAALLSAPASVLTDRWVRSRLLAVVLAGSGALTGVLVWCASVDAGLPVLLVVVAAGSAIGAAVRPTLQAMVPTLVTSPADLIAANAAYATIEAVGTVVGPGLCAALLGAVGPPGVLGVLAVLLGLAALVAAAIRTPFRPVRSARTSARAAWLAPLAGFRVLARPGLRLAISLFLGQTTMRGLLNVFVVLVATSMVGGSESRAGSLFIAMGVGGLVGAAVALGLGPQHGSRWIALGIALWGLPVVAIGLWPDATVASVALAVLGFGNALLDVSGYTLVNRLVPDHLAGRAWGAFSALGAAVVALGSLAAPLLAGLVGLTGAMVLTGAVLALAPAVTWRWLSRLDALASGRAEDVELLRRVPLFAALSLVGVERLARGARTRDLAAGEVVVEQGEPAADFYVIAEGAALVTRDGREVRQLGPAEAFGEIALLDPGPRTATVTTAAPTRLLVVDRDGFVAAVTGHRPTDDLARERVARLRSADEERSTGEPDGPR